MKKKTEFDDFKYFIIKLNLIINYKMQNTGI
jgi:hypothetical protein